MSGQWKSDQPTTPERISGGARAALGGMRTGRIAVIVAAGVGAVLVLVLVLTTLGMAGGSGATDEESSGSETDETSDAEMDGEYRIAFADQDGQCVSLSEQGGEEDRWVMAMRSCEEEPTGYIVRTGDSGTVTIGFQDENWEGQCLGPDGPPTEELKDADPEDVWYFAPYECKDDSVPFNFHLRDAGDDTYHLETAARQCLGVSEDDEFKDGQVIYTVPCDDAEALSFEEL